MPIICDICLEFLSLDQFRFLQCGHGFCRTCLAKTKNLRTCAICRQMKGNKEPRQIYLTFAEPEPTDAAGALNKIDVNSSTASLKRATQKIKREAEHVEHYVGDMVEAVHRLEERILPLFAEVEREKAEKAALLEEMSIVEAELGQTETPKTEITRLRANLEAALSDAEEVQNQVMEEREEGSRLKKVVQRLHCALDKKDEELRENQEHYAYSIWVYSSRMQDHWPSSGWYV